MSENLSADVSSPALRRTVLTVALLNLAYFGVEFSVALAIGSVSLFADSVDFLEDASVNLLILVALAWTACAFMLARYRRHSGSLTKAAFLSARNDAFANVAIVAAGLVTALVWSSAWPDLIVGLAIALMNADAAREVWRAAREEHRAAA
jgi:Co/Zn/Cd efflux system component